jgi:dihydrofolate reductase
MVFLYGAMSLDGFIAGPGHDMSWIGGAEYDSSSQLADEVARSTGVVLAGRGWREVAGADDGGLPSPESTEALVRTGCGLDTSSGTARVRPYGGGGLGPGDCAGAGRGIRRGQAVSIFGADVARLVPAFGRLDEIIVQIVPIVLGNGVRPFGEAPSPRVRQERTYVGTSGTLSDIRLRVAGAADE